MLMWPISWFGEREKLAFRKCTVVVAGWKILTLLVYCLVNTPVSRVTASVC